MNDHPAHQLSAWALTHGSTLLGVQLAICVLGILVGAVYLWIMSGARIIAAGWVWRQFLAGLRSRRRGGAGGRSAEYQAVMQSAAWRRRRSQAIRAAGRRCQECGAGGPLDVHHLSYAHLGDERPYELAVLCEGCHARAHGR